ncbi:hypothetical protein AMTR_s00040p00224300 [Amborella trichopoda]|uniref:Prolamin-like domain-containing protein n=1 Tax=Amborella trichopoda TaxID=13333 RepID=W1PYQ9_AMBTC|nr:hypothetical protein AMTR_s00040p00224300 [Amborella trichopoda]
MTLCMLGLLAAARVHAEDENDKAAGPVTAEGLGAVPPYVIAIYKMCWEAMIDFNNELNAIFVDGVAPSNAFCVAFEKLDPSCFFSMFNFFGFNVEQGKRLKAYCDVSAH